MLRTSICEALRSLTHSNCVNFDQPALCDVLKLPENLSSTTQKPFPIDSIIVWINVIACFNRCFDYCYYLLQSMFELLLLLVSIAFWIPVIACFNRCLDYCYCLFQSLIGLLLLLVSIDVWICFNSLQNTGENYFVIFFVI